MREVVAELEPLGFGATWVGEAGYREPVAGAAVLLSAASRMVVATGIANICVREPLAMVAAQLTLAEAYPERFPLGIAVSHAGMVEGERGHHYRQPFTAMRRTWTGWIGSPTATRPPLRRSHRLVCLPRSDQGCPRIRMACRCGNGGNWRLRLAGMDDQGLDSLLPRLAGVAVPAWEASQRHIHEGHNRLPHRGRGLATGTP